MSGTRNGAASESRAEIEVLYGTKLSGTLEALNAEAEHARIGLSWSYEFGFLDVASRPPPGANLSNWRGVCERLREHLASGRVDMRWNIEIGKPLCIEVTPDGCRDVECR